VPNIVSDKVSLRFYRKGNIYYEKENYPFGITAFPSPPILLWADNGTESKKTNNPYHVA